MVGLLATAGVHRGLSSGSHNFSNDVEVIFPISLCTLALVVGKLSQGVHCRLKRLVHSEPVNIEHGDLDA